MLAGLGYTVVASTGKSAEAPYLKSIGASEVIGRDAIATGPKPLEEQRWAGAIDAVGGAPLDQILRTMKKNGVVCCFGNAAGETFTSSIYPFILRSVKLVGINANHPVEKRRTAWHRMRRGGNLRPRHLDKICQPITLADLHKYCDQVIGGGIRGRALVMIR
jgi:putative YhdH/YhfP family quinone oxidoreductase